MAYQKQSRYTVRTGTDHYGRRTRSSKATETPLSTEPRYSRYTDLEQDPPRRRRWAAGYIDRPSCSSYAYISSRTRSADLENPSDSEYITQPRDGDIDYIEAHEQHLRYGSMRTAEYPETGFSEYRSSPVSSGLRHDQHPDTHEPYDRSDIEDPPAYRYTYQLATTSESHDSSTEEGSDIVIVNSKGQRSDIASIHSRCSSRSRSDRCSARSFSMQSDVRDKRTGDGDSDSDSDGGYISHDDYIVGRSDCVSEVSLSGDEGEGSDAVGSDFDGDYDMGEGSDVAHRSDVASLSDDVGLDDDDDCIEVGHSNRASKWRY